MRDLLALVGLLLIAAYWWPVAIIGAGALLVAVAVVDARRGA